MQPTKPALLCENNKLILSDRLRNALDGARAFASFYVPLHHVGQAMAWGGLLGLFARFGQEAVMLFFLLSGFVIFANEKERVADIGGYALRRAKRIYPALFVALLTSALVVSYKQGMSNAIDLTGLVGNLLMLQDVSGLKPGVIVSPFLGNTPLWSLSYEAGFYVLFPLAIGLWKRWPYITTHAIGASSCLSYLSFIAHPNHFALVLAYFQVWWLGAMVAAAYGNGARHWRSVAAPIIWLSLMTVISLLPLSYSEPTAVGVYPLLMTRHFGFSVIITMLLFCKSGKALSNVIHRCRPGIIHLTATSYGVYVLHYPILINSGSYQSRTRLFLAIVLLGATAWFADPVLSRIVTSASARTKQL